MVHSISNAALYSADSTRSPFQKTPQAITEPTAASHPKFAGLAEGSGVVIGLGLAVLFQKPETDPGEDCKDCGRRRE